MKLATRFTLVFIIAVIPVVAVRSQLAHMQVMNSIKDEHDEVVALLTELWEKESETFDKEVSTGNVLYIHERVKNESDYRTTFRLVFFEETVAAEHEPMDRRATASIQSEEVKSLPYADENMRALHTYFPIKSTDRMDAIEIMSSLEEAYELRTKTWWAAFQLITAMGLVGLGLVIFAGIRWIGRPLDAINEKMRRVAEGDFKGDLDIRTKDEFGQLADEINDMSHKLQQQQEQIVRESDQKVQALEQLRHADRLITVGQLAAGLAHEVGTPLNVVAGRASMILEEPDMEREKLQENALAIKNEAMRISSIVQRGLDYSRQGESKRSRSDVREVIDTAVELFRPLAERRQINLDVAVPDQAAIANIDTNQIQQVLMNLIDNAIQACNDGSSVKVMLQSDDDTGEWIIEITDDGQGIDPSNHDKVFQPFFTTKDAGYGTGLGLSIVKDIVEEHGGSIRFESESGTGTTFFVELPAD